MNNQGVVEPTKLDRGKIMNQIRQRLNQQPDDGDWIRWGRWLLADRETRTISPFARVTIPEYRERQAERRGLDDWCKAAALGESKGLNAVSWLLATSPAAEVRDGHLAVALAEKVVAATERKNPAMLDTLAAACAEAGQFSRAQSLEREALGLLHDENKKQDYDSRLRLYNSNRPYRNNSTNELTRAAEDRGRRAAFLQTRGALAAQFGLWKEGVRDLTEAVNLNPEDHFTWYQLAPVLLEAGDVDGYREHCRKMLARFGATDDPVIAERMAKACLFGPVSKERLAQASHLAEMAVTVGKEHDFVACFDFARGLAEYRVGNFGKAVEWTKKALEQGSVDFRDMQAQAVLAMAQQRLSRADEARAALAKANEIAQTKLAKRGSGDLGPEWKDWIIAHTLLREAKELIEGASAPSEGQQNRITN